MSPDSLKSFLRTEPRGPLLRRLAGYRVLLLLGTAIVVADQASKALIYKKLPFPTYGEPGAIPVIKDFFYIVHVGNTGAAWSMFTGQSVLLATLAIITLAAIVAWRQALGLRLMPVQICFGLLCGGIVGNLIDRLWHGHVIDFLDFHFGSYIYPTFNLADSAICIGVIVYIWHTLRTPTQD